MASLLVCDICSQSLWRPYGLRLVACEVCGLIRANLDSSSLDISALYGHGYFFGEEYFDYFQDREALEFNFKKRIEGIRPYLSKTVRAIEIGCAYGFFLKLLEPYVASCEGYDVAVEGVAHAKEKLGVQATTDNFLAYNKDRVDIVCMWDVLEHLSNPDQMIKKIADVVRPGGYLVLTTGDIGSLIARIRKDKWRMIHPPTHLFYFTKKTVRILLKKHGFTVTDIRYSATYRNIGSVCKQIEQKRIIEKKPSTFIRLLSSILKKTKVDRLNFGLNLFDIMEVTAVRDKI